MKKSVELSDGTWADAVVVVNATTGTPVASNPTPSADAPAEGYTYDNAGRILTKWWTVNGVTKTKTFSYDAVGRMSGTVTV